MNFACQLLHVDLESFTTTNGNFKIMSLVADCCDLIPITASQELKKIHRD